MTRLLRTAALVASLTSAQVAAADEGPEDARADEVPAVEGPTGAPPDRVQGDNVPRDNVPGDNVPRDNVPRDNVPGDNVPRDNVPRDNVPDGSAAGVSTNDTAAAIQLTYGATTRAQGIAILERSWALAADLHGARLALARALSWDRRFDEALGHYDALLAMHPTLELELERLQVLMWRGDVREAQAGYERLASAHPTDASAQTGLARALRWQGRPLAALARARRAVAIAPDATSGRDELALVYTALGLPDAATDAIGGRAPSKEVQAAIEEARRPQLSASTTATTDSFGIDRVAPRAKATWGHTPDLRLQVGGGSTHMRHGDDTLHYAVLAGELALLRPHVELAIGGAGYTVKPSPLGEISGRATIRPIDKLSLTVGLRRRPFLELAEPLATNEAAFFAATSGATMLEAVSRRGVDEARLGGNVAPRPGMYLYTDARLLRLSDGNTGYTVVSGAGIDVLALLGVTGPIAVIARADSFATGYRMQRPDYFSPGSFHNEMFGAQLAFRQRAFTAAAYGTSNTSLGTDLYGWSFGGALDATIGSVVLSIRAERRDDLAYQLSRGWLAVTGKL
jgi:hypothetical protein